MMRLIDRLVDLTAVRNQLKPFYSNAGRRSIDPELLIRMLIIGRYGGSGCGGSFF